MASTILNPLTPMAYFPPDIAYQIQICEYIDVGSLAAYVWDLLYNLQNDYKLLSSYKFSIGMAAYFFSRLASFMFLFYSVLFHTYPLDHCEHEMVINLVFYAIAIPANSFLFFLRGRAIFNRNPFLVAFLFLLWLSVLGTAITAPIGVKGANIGPTKFCFTASGEPYVGASGIMPLVHDTVVFLLISWRLFQNSHLDHMDGLGANIRAFFTGEHLPRFSRAVMQDGQLYYLIALTANLVVVIMFYNTQVETTFSTMFTTCNVMLTNAMACHVFRNTKFGYHKRVVSTSELLTRTRDTQSIIFMHRRAPKRGGTDTDATTNIAETTPNVSQSFIAKAEILADAGEDSDAGRKK